MSPDAFVREVRSAPTHSISRRSLLVGAGASALALGLGTLADASPDPAAGGGSSAFASRRKNVPVGSHTIFSEGFASFNFDRWTSVQTHSYDGAASDYDNAHADYRLKIVKQGSQHPHVLRTEVHDGDTAVGSHERAEISSFGQPWNDNRGDERWYEFDVRFGDPTWNPKMDDEDDWLIFFQWHQPIDEGSPALALSVHHDGIAYFEREANDEIQPFIPVFPVRAGKWERVVIHVKWSPDPQIGFVHAYVNGDETVPVTYCQTQYTSDFNDYYVKMGQYRRKSVGRGTVVMHDNLRISGGTPTSGKTRC
jgi:hypothetical protein